MMSTATLALGVVGVIVLGSALHDLWRWYRLRHIQGPFVCGFTMLWLVRKCLDGATHEEFKALSERYGPLVRIGPNHVLCTDAETLRRIGGIRSGYTKSEWHISSRLNPGEDHIFSLYDEKLRKERKGKIARGYSGKANGGFEEGVDRAIQGLIDLFERKYTSTDSDFRPIDLGHRLQFFTLDAIGEISVSKPFGFLANDRDMHRFIEINDAVFPVTLAASNYLPIVKALQSWPLRYLLPREGDAAGFGMLMGFISDIVNQRLKADAKPKRDILQSFIDSGLTREELKQELCLQILAASDTTASALRMTILYLISSPPAYRKLLAEIDAAVSAGTLSTPVRDSEAKDLPYLQAVIREGLRMYPPATASFFYKVVPKGGDIICGQFVPGGTQIATGMAPYPVCRSKAFWGDDADLFRPERWLEPDDGRLQVMTNALDLAFGAGRFQCLGKGLAWIELNKVFVELLRRYDFTVVNPMKPMSLIGAVVWISNDFWVRVTKR